MIPVIADIPKANPGLGFQEYAQAIADAVKGGEPPQFTIGLYGAWGTGKSSLLKAIANSLDEGEDTRVIPVLFDAWRYERSEHIIVPMLYSVYSSIQKRGDDQILAQLKRGLRSVIYGLTFNIGVPGSGVGVNPQSMMESWESQGLPTLDEAFSRPFSELRALPEALDGRRIAVLIDDLDRCSPQKVVAVLESINLVMDVPGFIFVLALDYEVLVDAIKQEYPHVSGDRFIEKMVQLSFRVPPLSLEQSSFLDELVPNWSKWATDLPEGFSEHIRDISQLGLGANPRQIKRLINSFLLLRRVIYNRKLSTDLKVVAALIGVQLRWPAEFRDFQNAVLSGDLSDESYPLLIFKEQAPDPSLRRYAEQLLNTEASTSDIKQILRLSSAVVVDKEAP